MCDALAYNISKSLILKREEVIEGNTPSCSPSDIMKSALRLSNRKSKPIDVNDADVSEMVSCLSEKAKETVKYYLTLSDETFAEPTIDLNALFKIEDYFKFNLWDFSGNSLYFIVNQILLTPYAVYVLVIDVSEDLDAPICQSLENLIQVEMRKKDFSTLQLIHFWLTVLYAQVGTYALSQSFDTENNDESCISSPKVIIVGTHRNSVHLEPLTRDQMVNDTFERILQSLEGKVYKDLVHPKCVAIDCTQMSCDEPSLISEICENVDKIFTNQKLVNFDIPFCWVELRKVFEKLIKRGIHFADFRQIHEVTRSQFSEFANTEILQMALDFYHSQGTIYCFTSNYFGVSETLVILDPLWFVSHFHRLCDTFHEMSSDERESFFSGIFKEELIEKIWINESDHKMLLIGCLERLDIICELCPYVNVEEAPDVAASAMQSKMYIFPWITQTLPESLNGVGLEYDLTDENSLELIIDFNDLLPIGLFSRFSVRLCRWSWSQGWGRRPEVCHSETRIAVDFDHDLIIKINLERSHINVYIIKIYEGMHSEHNSCSGPTPNICVKVRHLIETELEIIQNSFYRRVTYSLQVRCPCDLKCSEHDKTGCQQSECAHFLPLNDCLSNKVVECDYRQVRTNFVQKYFPQASFYSAGISNYDQLVLSENNTSNLYDVIAGWETVFNIEPTWMKDASKMLTTNPGRDWIALAKRLGYSDRDVSKLVDEVTPALALLRDWYESNGRTRYCIDVLLSCLRMISREDVINTIESDVEPEGTAPPIFISYQWDSQQVVLDLRRRLELSGFPCWMDVGLLAGGDSLYGKIYEGISRAKIVVCCLTPRYVASRLCTREVTLADVLHKPILPIMVEPTPWPPPGPMAVIMSSLVYIDLCNIGAHGGIGKRGDSETRFRDILDRISRYLSGYVDAPLIPRNFPILDLFSPVRSVTPQISAAAPAEVRPQTPEEQQQSPEMTTSASQVGYSKKFICV
ncbi:Neuralized-like protein, partial [Leptotrombidium deliense]